MFLFSFVFTNPWVMHLYFMLSIHHKKKSSSCSTRSSSCMHYCNDGGLCFQNRNGDVNICATVWPGGLRVEQCNCGLQQEDRQQRAARLLQTTSTRPDICLHTCTYKCLTDALQDLVVWTIWELKYLKLYFEISADFKTSTVNTTFTFTKWPHK